MGKISTFPLPPVSGFSSCALSHLYQAAELAPYNANARYPSNAPPPLLSLLLAYHFSCFPLFLFFPLFFIIPSSAFRIDTNIARRRRGKVGGVGKFPPPSFSPNEEIKDKKTNKKKLGMVGSWRVSGVSSSAGLLAGDDTGEWGGSSLKRIKLRKKVKRQKSCKGGKSGGR